MAARISFYLLFLLLCYHHSYGQNNQELGIAIAKVDSLEDVNGKNSYPYIEAIVQLSGLYFQQNNNKAGNQVLEEAFVLITNNSDTSLNFRSVFNHIPSDFKGVATATLELHQALKEHGNRSPFYIEKLLYLSKAHRLFQTNQSYKYCLKAFELIAESLPEYQPDLYSYAYQNIDPIILTFVHAQLELKKTSLESPNTLKQANALLKLAKFSLEFKDTFLIETRLDSSYLYIKEALSIYEKKWNKKHSKYSAAFQVFTPEMKDFYPIEKEILDKFYNNDCANDDFFFLLRPFLHLVKENQAFLTYTPLSFFALLEEKTKSISNKKYKTILAAIKPSLESDANSIQLRALELNLELSKLENDQPYSIKHADALINLANYWATQWDTKKALDYYLQAFEEIKEVEENSNNSTADLKGERLRKLPSFWIELISQELKISGFAPKYATDVPTIYYLEALLETGYKYFKKYEEAQQKHELNLSNNVNVYELKKRGENHLLKALKLLPPDLAMIADNWLSQVFQLNPNSDYERIQKALIKRLPAEIIDSLLRISLTAIEAMDIDGQKSLDYARLEELIADAYFFEKDNLKGEATSLLLYKKILQTYRELEGQQDNYLKLLQKIVRNILEAESQKKLSLINKTPWLPEDNVYFFELLTAVFEKKEKNSSASIIHLAKYATWHYDNNRYVDASPLFRKYVRLFEDKSFEEQRISRYAESLFSLGRTYRKNGQFLLSKNYYDNAWAFGVQSNNIPLQIRCLDDLGLLSNVSKQPDDALIFYNKALVLLQNLADSSNAVYKFKRFEKELEQVKILRHIARTYLDKNALNKAQEYYQKIEFVYAKFQEIPFDDHKILSIEKDISLQRDLALLHERLGDKSKALFYYDKAIHQLSDKSELADALISLARFYEKQGKDSLFVHYFLAALNLDLEQLKMAYPNLSEQERLPFLATIEGRIQQFFELALSKSDSLLIPALDAHLAIKGLALESAAVLQNSFYATQNEDLKLQYHQMQLLRNQLASSFSLSYQEKEKIVQEIQQIEGQIPIKLKAIVQQKNQQTSYKKLQQLLDSTAVAIDFLTLEELDEDGYKQLFYYAVLVRSQDTIPVFLRLTTARELEDVLHAEIAPNSYNYITDISESNYLFQLIFEPLLPYLKTAKTLHICPTGMLNKIAFGTLHLDNYSNQQLLDKWSLHYYSSLRDLQLKTVNSSLNSPKRIGLIGGVKFTFSEQDFVDIKQRRKLVDTIQNSFVEGTFASATIKEKPVFTNNISSPNRGENFDYLAGTLREISTIQQQFQEQGWDVKTLTDTAAIEENINLFGVNAPTILHLATHGFFFYNSPKEEEDYYTIKRQKISPPKQRFEEKIANLNDPLSRSGLALAGINRVWRGGATIEGLSDGILTALEVSNINLYGTELVVLSACETGRGDLDNNEGVMGLFRAFKIAGAKNLITSLWKVPDAQTAELMQVFYKEYLVTNNIHQAFETAQKQLKKKYKNPYYWAAFVLME